jgi:ubiquinone/menaquinone biosynthesis C-methylase UbiE
MGIYSDVIIPFFYDKSMDKPYIKEARKNILKNVSGEVLEIGFGTGLNLPHYPSSVTKLTIVDKNPGMNKQAQERISASKFKIVNKIVNSEELPFDDESFDSVVSTFTLCSIQFVDKALMEIHRTLKHDGKFFFQEHGLSNDPKIQKWQNRLNPVQKIWADGCNLNRNIKLLIQEAGFKVIEFKNYFLKKGLKTHTFMYEGVACK